MRSGYSDEYDGRDYAMWRGRVASAMRGKRGQQLLRDCLAALDAMPAKRLIPELLVDGEDVCLLGAVGKLRKIPDLEKLDPEDHDRLGNLFDVAPCLIMEIEFENDERLGEVERAVEGRSGTYMLKATPEDRYDRMRKWLLDHIDERQPRG